MVFKGKDTPNDNTKHIKLRKKQLVIILKKY